MDTTEEILNKAHDMAESYAAYYQAMHETPPDAAKVSKLYKTYLQHRVELRELCGSKK